MKQYVLNVYNGVHLFINAYLNIRYFATTDKTLTCPQI